MYFRDDELRRIKQYKGGVTQDNSIAYRYAISPLCAKIVTFLPSWLAPNVLTAVGLLCNIVAYALVAWHAPDLTRDLPGWVYVAVALLIWSYMILDNCDGKQAFRTGSSSPLGELFDHGCDSLTIGMGSMTLAGVLRGGPWLALAITANSVVPFFLAHWEEYFNHFLVLGSWNGPTEAECAIIGVFLLTFFAGSSFWVAPVHLFGYTIRANELLVTVMAVISIYTALMSVWNGSLLASRKGIRLSLAYSYYVPFVISYASCVAWLYLEPAGFAAHPHLFLVGTSFLFGYLMILCIIQRMCDLSFSYFYWPLTPIVLAGLHSCLAFATGMRLLPNAAIFSAIFTFYFINLCVFVSRVISGFTEALKIRVFSIPYPNKATK